MYREEENTLKRTTRSSNKKKVFKEPSDDDLDLKNDDEENNPKKKKKKFYGLKSWTCSQCQEVFLETKLWQRHKAQKDCTFEPPESKWGIVPKHPRKKKSHTCRVCHEIFKTQRLLKAHRKTHKPDEIEEEADPSYKFDELQELYICGVCSAEFQEKAEADEHIKTHIERLACPTCKEEFKGPYDLGIHTSTHDTEHKVRCCLCPYSTLNPYAFKAHVNYVHLKRFPYYCTTCDRGFKQHKTYQEHQNLHTGTKPYICVVCGKAFTFQKYLTVHQVRNHQVGTTGSRIENECRKCNRYFKKPEALQEHLEECVKKKKEKKGKCFLCDTCGQSFTEKAKLLEHLRVHAGELPFVCTWCGKRFPKKDYLKCHERVHTGEKPYSCEFCGKRFGHHSPFRVHKRTHTGERPYVCPVCSKGFTTNQGLKLHKKNCPGNQLNKVKGKQHQVFSY